MSNTYKVKMPVTITVQMEEMDSNGNQSAGIAMDLLMEQVLDHWPDAQIEWEPVTLALIGVHGAPIVLTKEGRSAPTNVTQTTTQQGETK